MQTTMLNISVWLLTPLLLAGILPGDWQQRERKPGQYRGAAPTTRIGVDSIANGTVYTITLTDPAYTFDSARYSIFIPEHTGPLRGVYVHQHGCTMEGRGVSTAYDVQYQAFAKKWGLALVGPDLYSAKGNCHDWRNAESGSGKALIASLTTIGNASGHPELAGAPWLLWGHSGGGYWTLSMLRHYPERILAIFGYSPAFEPGEYPAAALKVPVMMRHAGPEGDVCCWQTSLREFHKLRAAGGLASIAYTPYQNHNYSFVRYMSIPFYESVLTQRLPAGKGGDKGRNQSTNQVKGKGRDKSPNSSDRDKNMRDMDPSLAWLGDTARLNIYPAAFYPGNKLSAAWLPDSLVAAKWREYLITGTVIDRTPPPPPYAVRIQRRHNVTVALSWKADADIESGISHFNIYKGNQLVGRFPSHGAYQQFDTNGDDAYPLQLPELRTDITLVAGDSATLSVATVNHFGLESTRSAVP